MIVPFILILGMIVMIPVLAIVLDSPLSDALARRIAGRDSSAKNPDAARLEQLEQDVQYLTQSVEGLREEAAFVRALVEGQQPPEALPAPDSVRSRGRRER